MKQINDAGEFGVNTAPDTVRFERLLPGPIERVWDFLTDSEKRGRWLASGSLEPRVGSKFELRFHNSTLTTEPVPERFQKWSGEIVGRHTVTRYEPLRVLGITWDEEEGGSEVVFELSAEGDRVRLVLTHVRLSGEGRLNVSSGWHAHLAVLAERLEGREPQAFWSIVERTGEVYRARAEAAA